MSGVCVTCRSMPTFVVSLLGGRCRIRSFSFFLSFFPLFSSPHFWGILPDLTAPFALRNRAQGHWSSCYEVIPRAMSPCVDCRLAIPQPQAAFRDQKNRRNKRRFPSGHMHTPSSPAHLPFRTYAYPSSPAHLHLVHFAPSLSWGRRHVGR